MEGSKRTATHFGHLCCSTKNKQKKQKQKQKQKQKLPHDRKFVLNNTSNRYQFIMTRTRGENLWPQSQK